MSTEQSDTTPEGMKPKAPSREKLVTDQLQAVYKEANDEDRAQARELVGRAKAGAKESVVVGLRPGTAAILFHDHNKQNRLWRPAVTGEYATQMINGEWEFTNQGLGFLVSGDLGDGQHRAAAAAISGRVVEMSVTFGMTFSSIIAIDTGHRRGAADFLGINKQVSEAKRKETVLKKAFSTLRRLATPDDGDDGKRFVLRPGNRDTAKAIVTYNHLLDEALEIGEDSIRGRTKPTFSATDASSLAFLLLVKGWPKARIISDLDVFQSGEDREGGNSPLFVAADQLQKDAQRKEGAAPTARFAAAIKAFVLHEQGVKAVRVSEIRSAMKARAGVNPAFPGTVSRADAAD